LRTVRGLTIVVMPGVLDPSLFFSSEVLVDSVAASIRRPESVLDLGTGCGIGALAAARAGAGRVVAVDIDPVAVRCARANVQLAGWAERIEVRHGDLFAPVGDERFDRILFNPPYLSGRAPHDLARALVDPGDMGERFAHGLGAHLAPGGTATLVLSDHGRPGGYLEPLAVIGFELSAAIVRDRGSEVLTAWQVRPRGRGRAA
jgi:release factor glutamine methyltransferase